VLLVVVELELQSAPSVGVTRRHRSKTQNWLFWKIAAADVAESTSRENSGVCVATLDGDEQTPYCRTCS
jgi:hypothetical protein